MTLIPITPALIARAAELAGLGLPLRDVARGCGASERWLYGVLARARSGEGAEPELQLLQAIQGGQQAGTEALVRGLRDAARNGDTKAATWLLSHSPVSRDAWSEAGATRAALKRQEASIITAIDDAVARGSISAAGRRTLLLGMVAAGVDLKLETTADVDDMVPASPPPDAPFQPVAYGGHAPPSIQEGL